MSTPPWEKQILETITHLPPRPFRYSDLDNWVSQNRERWHVPHSYATSQIVKRLAKFGGLTKHTFSFPSRNEIRYTVGDVPLLQLINSLKDISYFVHQTALYLNKLTDKIEGTIFLNCEQSAKSKPRGKLEQQAIDRAFRGKPRISKYRANFKKHEVCILNGMNMEQLGVIQQPSPEHGTVRFTNVERTLIDITVRPFYAGGVANVLTAYRKAASHVEIVTLAKMYQTIGYTYPYHQAIGFYLEKSGAYQEDELALFDGFEKQFNFYLDYRMENVAYSKRWKVYYPKALD